MYDEGEGLMLCLWQSQGHDLILTWLVNWGLVTFYIFFRVFSVDLSMSLDVSWHEHQKETIKVLTLWKLNEPFWCDGLAGWFVLRPVSVQAEWAHVCVLQEPCSKVGKFSTMFLLSKMGRLWTVKSKYHTFVVVDNSKMLDVAFLMAVDNREKYLVFPKRFDHLFRVRRVKVRAYSSTNYGLSCLYNPHIVSPFLELLKLFACPQ